ncbi:MAG TPA: response regulator transcription factor [Solirubrobacteraceae bacterium]|nr:response regulator transcription factor [Solirubrobacteraceae bacterium]
MLARFEDIVGLGLRALIDEDENLELLASDVPHENLNAILAGHQPRVAILNFGSLTSAVELRTLHRRFPQTRLLVLANRPQPSECRQMLSFGATACLAKSTEARDVLHAIHLASRGLHVLPPVVADGTASQSAGPELLTPREAEVMELLQAGRSNAEIAHELHVGIETVRTHARHVYRKLGVRTRRELRSAGGQAAR